MIETFEHSQTGDRFDKESSGTAMTLSKAIDFEFCLHLMALSRILQVTGFLSKYLQRRYVLLVDDCRGQQVSVRSDDFEKMWTETVRGWMTDGKAKLCFVRRMR